MPLVPLFGRAAGHRRQCPVALGHPSGHFQQIEEFGVKVGVPLRDDVDDHNGDLLLQVAGALGGEGPAGGGTVLVAGTDQFHGGDQTRVAAVVVNLNLEHVRGGERDVDRSDGAGRRPNGGGHGNAAVSAFPRGRRSFFSFQRGDVHFDGSAEMG